MIDRGVYDDENTPLTIRLVAVNRNEVDDLDDAATLIRQVARGRRPTFNAHDMHRLASVLDEIGMRWNLSERVAS